jgi:adenylate cyclase
MSPSQRETPDPAAPGVALGVAETWPVQIRDFLTQHIEFLFVLLVTASAFAVFYLFPYRIAFLNFFYLPVLAAAYFMGKRKAVLLAALCVLSGVLFAYYRAQWFAVEGTRVNALLVLATWGGFLILASAAIGSLQERLAKGFEETRQLY